MGRGCNTTARQERQLLILNRRKNKYAVTTIYSEIAVIICSNIATWCFALKHERARQRRINECKVRHPSQLGHYGQFGHTGHLKNLEKSSVNRLTRGRPMGRFVVVRSKRIGRTDRLVKTSQKDGTKNGTSSDQW